MENIEMQLKGNILTVRIDLSKENGVSKSGKSITVASTKGNKTIEGTDCIVGINVYKKA